MVKEKFPREAQAKWDKQHLRTVSTRVTVEQNREIVEFCRRRHTTRYRMVKRAIAQYMVSMEGDSMEGVL